MMTEVIFFTIIAAMIAASCYAVIAVIDGVTYLIDKHRKGDNQ